MQLRNIDAGKLVVAAGGDPWQVNSTLQSGQPAQISDLAQAFHDAGQCTAEAGKAFTEARDCFEASWNRKNGDHPINDSNEVQRTTKALGAHAAQLPKIAVDLENIAVDLAEAQRSSGEQIAALETQLQTLDDWIGQDENRLRQSEKRLTQEQLEHHISDCEHKAIDDTKTILGQVNRIRDQYSETLQASLSNLRIDGYNSAAIQWVDGEHAEDQVLGDVSPSGSEPAELADIKRVTNQAVVDQMAKVRAAQQAIRNSLTIACTKGQGSPEGQAALKHLPQLKKNLADALNALGNLPDYNDIDPTAVRTSSDGHFMFGYTADGQPVQVTGQLKNGTGEIFDQRTLTYYTFKDGKLAGTHTLDPGRVEATNEPLFTAITLAVGAPELKAGGEATWQGLKALFGRALTAGADITSDNIFPRAVAAAEIRTETAAHNLADAPLPHTPAGVTAEPHTPPLGGSGPPPPEISHPLPVGEMPHPLPPDSPLFNGYHPIDPGPEFAFDNPLDHISPGLRVLSEQHLTGSGETVLGPFRPAGGGPSYIEIAQQHGASYFDIGDAWNAATQTERLAANQHVLDIAIANGDTITLSVPLDRLDADTFTAAEIRYLELHGYRQINDITWTSPGRGAAK